jgi:uncharacterized iron-regulated membrane protein
VHAWGAAALALFVLLSSLTGVLLVWKQTYLKLVIPEARVEFVPEPAALARIVESIEAQFDVDDIGLIQLATRDFPLTKVTLADTRYAYVDVEGNIVAQWFMNERWEEWLYDLHHRLLLGNRGLAIVGFIGLAMMLLVIAGVVSFWPMRRGLRLGIRPKGAERTHLLVTHRNIGVFEALPFLLTLATGAVLAFPFQTEAWLLDPVRRTQEYSDSLIENLDDISGENSGEWLPAMTRALATFPAGEVRSVTVANRASPYRIIGVKQPDEWHPDGMSRVYIEAASGYMDVRFDAVSLPGVERAYHAVYPLHTGKLDSLPYKLFLTLSGLLAATLASLGLVCFLRGRFGERR